MSKQWDLERRKIPRIITSAVEVGEAVEVCVGFGVKVTRKVGVIVAETVIVGEGDGVRLLRTSRGDIFNSGSWARLV